MSSEIQCNKCREMLSTDNFWISRTTKRGYQSYCKTCTKKHKRDDYPAKKAAKNKYKKEWRDSNRNKENAYNKVYRANNKFVYAAKEQRRRARTKNNGIYKITKKELQKLYQSNCFYCKTEKATTIDHVIPIAKGGPHSIGNLLPACRPCNESKKDKFLIEFRQTYLKGQK